MYLSVIVNLETTKYICLRERGMHTMAFICMKNDDEGN